MVQNDQARYSSIKYGTVLLNTEQFDDELFSTIKFVTELITTQIKNKQIIRIRDKIITIAAIQTIVTIKISGRRQNYRKRNLLLNPSMKLAKTVNVFFNF